MGITHYVGVAIASASDSCKIFHFIQLDGMNIYHEKMVEGKRVLTKFTFRNIILFVCILLLNLCFDLCCLSTPNFI